MDGSEVLVSILWLVALFVVARIVLLVIKAPKRVDELEKRVRKLENRIIDLEFKEKK